MNWIVLKKKRKKKLAACFQERMEYWRAEIKLQNDAIHVSMYSRKISRILTKFSMIILSIFYTGFCFSRFNMLMLCIDQLKMVLSKLLCKFFDKINF